ncbi:hypothetical protein Bpfe_023951, partial [Biomphalaria pfeifferi]
MKKSLSFCLPSESFDSTQKSWGSNTAVQVGKRALQRIKASTLPKLEEEGLTRQRCNPTWSVNTNHPRTKLDLIDWSVPSTDAAHHLPPLSPGSLTYQLARRDFRRCSLDCGSRSCDGKNRTAFGKRKKCTCESRKSRSRLAHNAPVGSGNRLPA